MATFLQKAITLLLYKKAAEQFGVSAAGICSPACCFYPLGL